MGAGKIIPCLLLLLVFASFISILFADDITTFATNVFIVPKTISGAGETAIQGFEISVAKITTITQRLNDEQRRELLRRRYAVPDPTPGSDAPVPSIIRDIADQVRRPTAEYEYLQNAHVRVEYHQPSTGGWAPVAGCEDIQTTGSRSIYDTRTGREATVYYATCTVPRDPYYSGRCAQFKATFIPRPDLNPADRNLRYDQETSELCDGQIGPIGAFGAGISDILGPSGLGPENPRYWLSVGIVALLGMLLSAMYFSGRSPISLLDIAQPRLPGPKGLTAGGQILGPFGYTELKKTTQDKLRAGAKVLGVVAGGTRLRAGTKSGLDRMTSALDLPPMQRMAKNITKEQIADAKAFATGLGSLYAKVGGDINNIRPLLTKRVQEYRRSDHDLAGRVLNEIEQRGTAQDMLMARTLRQQIEGTLLMSQLNRLTGVEGGPLSRGLLRRKLIGETIGGGRYSVLSYWLAPMVDSTIRSTNVFGRFAQATAAEAIFGFGKGFEKLAGLSGSTRLKAASSGVMHGLSEKIKAFHPDYIPVGGKSPIADKMAHLYATMENEAYRNLMQHALKRIYERYGVVLELGTLLRDLPGSQQDLHGILLVNLAEKAGITAAKVSQLKAVESEIRAILSSSAAGHEKLAAIINLAEAHGVAIHGTAFDEAVTGINNIRARTAVPEHLRLSELEEHLSHFYPRENEAVSHGQFTYTVGRRLSEQEAFEAIVLRRMIQDIEAKRYAGEMGIQDVLNSAYAGRENRIYTINPLASARHLQFDEHGNIIRSQELLKEAEAIARLSFGGGNLPEDARRSLMRVGINPDGVRTGIITGEQLIGMQERGLKALRGLLTEEGKKALRDFFGAGFDVNKATMNELQFLLYGGAEILRNRGFTPEQIKKMEHGIMGAVDPKTGKVFWPGTDIELKPNQEHWKTDMGRLWAFAPSDRESYALAQWVKNRFARPHESALNVEDERRLEQRRGSVENELARLMALGMKETEAIRFLVEDRGLEARQLWVKRALLRDVHNELNSSAPEAYEVSGSRIRDLSQQIAALLARTLEKDAAEKGNANAARDVVRFLTKDFNPLDREHRNRLSALMQEHEKIFKAYMEKPVSYQDVTTGKQVWVMLYEGGMVPYVKGMRLSDNDRVLGGYVALRDEQGRAKRFDPNNVKIDFRERDLQLLWNRIASEIDPHRLIDIGSDLRGRRQWSWQDLISELKTWKSNDTEREKIYAAVVWRYANVTHDWGSHWQESGIEVVSKREAAPFAPQLVRFFTGKDFDVMERVKPIRNALLGAGDMLSRVSILAGGAASDMRRASVLEASYAVTPFSEYYRLNSWRLTHDILRIRNWDEQLADVADPKARQQIRSAYESMALSHGAYHQAWDYVIDRNPWRTSCSYGAHQAWASFFQFGPAEPFPIRFNLRAIYTGQQFTPTSSPLFNRFVSGMEWATFYAQYGWQMRASRALFLPYALAMRAFQMSIQGYPSRWDIKESPMKPWNYTTPRVGEAFRAISPFATLGRIDLPFSLKALIPNFFGRIPLLNRFDGKTIDISEPWGSSLERTHLGGREFGKGLRQVPDDISFNRIGSFSTARTGEANPGGSYYDYRAYLHLDPAMAEYLAYRSGEMSAYFKQDKYVREQALTGVIKRTVSAEARVMRAEEELRGFGPLQNPLYGWFNPFLYLWHSPIPFLPQLSPKEWITGYIQKKQRGEGIGIADTMFGREQWRRRTESLSRNYGIFDRAAFTEEWRDSDRGIFRNAWEAAKVGLFTGVQWRPGRKVFAASCPRCGTGGYLGTVCRGCSTILYDAPYAPNASQSRALPKKWAASWSMRTMAAARSRRGAGRLDTN